jgi:hypothetical protein
MEGYKGIRVVYPFVYSWYTYFSYDEKENISLLFSSLLFLFLVLYYYVYEPSVLQPQISYFSSSEKCFDHYQPQSVQVNIGKTSSAPIVAGSPVTFRGILENKNTYPIVDGQIYVKVFKKHIQKDGETGSVDDVIDQFVVKEDISLDAKGKQIVQFSWPTPKNLASGAYKIGLFFEASKRFDLLGLSFHDVAIGNVEYFDVVNKVSKNSNIANVAFDKNSVTMNDQAFYFTGAPLYFTATTSVTISAKLVNPLNDEIVVPVTCTTYNFDALRKENIVEQKTQQVTLSPQEIKTISCVENKNKGSASYVVIESLYDGVKSILNTRFMRTGIEDARITFLGVTHYPLKNNEASELFSCFASVADDSKDDEVTLIVQDTQGKVIYQYEYRGAITQAITGSEEEFIPTKSYTDFTVTAVHTYKGKVVDEIQQIYSCNDINPKLCPKDTPKNKLFEIDLNVTLLASIVVLFVLVIITVYKNRKNNQTKSQ